MCRVGAGPCAESTETPIQRFHGRAFTLFHRFPPETGRCSVSCPKRQISACGSRAELTHFYYQWFCVLFFFNIAVDLPIQYPSSGHRVPSPLLK